MFLANLKLFLFQMNFTFPLLFSLEFHYVY